MSATKISVDVAALYAAVGDDDTILSEGEDELFSDDDEADNNGDSDSDSDSDEEEACAFRSLLLPTFASDAHRQQCIDAYKVLGFENIAVQNNVIKYTEEQEI